MTKSPHAGQCSRASERSPLTELEAIHEAQSAELEENEDEAPIISAALDRMDMVWQRFHSITGPAFPGRGGSSSSLLAVPQ